MREYKAIFICILICNVFVCPKSFGQTDYTYEKGKSFKNTNALSMTDTIDLTSISSPIPYKKSIPGQTQTIACPVRLPGYVRGIFFSRDSRPVDFEWPNNTNRLLPWVFNDLKELTDTRYPGIPSNATPSTLGDALLLELTNGEYLFAKAVAGRNSLSWLQVNDNGSVTLYVSTLGKDYLKPEVPLLLIRQGKDIYSTIRQAYQALMKNTEAADLKSRTAKEYFEAFRYLGWCTWEHYHDDINESKVINDMKTIEASGIPIRYVLIDDGHLAHKNRKLTGFIPDKQRFPSGWKKSCHTKKKIKSNGSDCGTAFRDTGWDYPPKTDFHKSSDKPYTHTPAAFCQERTAPASVPSIATTSAP